MSSRFSSSDLQRQRIPRANRRLVNVLAALLLSFSDAGALEIRTIDGSSNNLANPSWGMAGTALIRLTPPAYADGAHVPRGGAPSGLTSAREISNAVSAQDRRIVNASGASDWLWQWGQFLDHDLDLTGPASPREPFDIAVADTDALFDPMSTGTRTIALDRSEHVTHAGVRQQVNVLTAYIDGSNVYGSDAARAAYLRVDDGYELKMSTGLNGEVLLGYNDGGLANGSRGGNPSDFFLAGDVRANEQVGLTAVHTLFAREHNRQANEIRARLHAGGPENAALVAERDATIAAPDNGVDDEDDFIFEAARKLVGAQIQHITYREFLPLLLGVDLVSGYSGSLYDPGINAGVSNEFSTAAFRLGHTMLSGDLLRIDDAGGSPVATTLALRDAFFNPGEVFEHGVDSLLKGLSLQAAQAIDTLIVDDVRNFLFGPPGAGGFDLASLNVQRGRDHGLGSLNAVRQALGLGAYADFNAMTGGDPALAAAFASVYGSVDEVDLWPGGLAEPAWGAGMIGQTFTHILLDQFTRSMLGDRFFYLNERAALEVLDPDFFHSSRLGDIIRRNTSLSYIADDVFRVPQRYHVPEPPAVALVLAALLASRLPGRRRT